MGKLAAIRTWFQGKKTILGGSLLILCGIAGVFTGKLSLIDATTVAGLGISICGMGAKANRYLGALEAVATAGVDLRLGNKAGALAALKPVAMQVAEDVAGPSLVSGTAPALTLVPATPFPPVPIHIPELCGDDAMRPGPARTATAEERAALFAKATGEAKS